jgi:hypothetical protein
MEKIIKMKRVLGFEDFFPTETPYTKEEYASKIGKDLLEQSCCHFLSFFRHRAIPPIEELLQDWFTFNDFKYFKSPSYVIVESEYRRIRNFHPSEQHEIISVESLLNMFSWAHENKNIPQSIQAFDASMTMPLFKLYLLFNSDVLRNYEKIVNSIRPYGQERKVQRLLLGMSFPQSDLINIDYAQLFYTQVYKAVKLLSFIETNSTYEPFLIQLLDDFTCSSKEEYIKAIGSAVFQSIKGTKPGWTVLTTKNSEDRDKADHILKELAIGDNEMSGDQDDYLLLRNKPFQKIADGEYRVIFDLFLIKKLYNGLIFKLSSFDKDFLSDIRNDFSEGILVYETLQFILKSKNSVTMTGNEFKAKELEREPDFYAEESDNILLFESKDFFMPGKSKLSYDFPIIEGELMKEGRLKKAVLQLKKNIERCILNELPVERKYKNENLKIFPIIIVHDSLYSAAALNYWIYYWLSDEIEILKLDSRFENFDFNRVMPLTIIEIDTLILYQNYFKEKKMNLVRLIESYHDFVRFDLAGKVRPESVEEHANKSAIPFSEFVRDFSHQLKLEIDFKILSEMLKQYGIS